MANLNIKFEVIIHEERGYTYDTMGNGSVQITIPEEITASIEPGNMFRIALESALVDMQEKITKKEQEEKKEKES